jgi:hypothetical protein
VPTLPNPLPPILVVPEGYDAGGTSAEEDEEAAYGSGNSSVMKTSTSTYPQLGASKRARRRLGAIDQTDIADMRAVADDLAMTVQRSALRLLSRMTTRTALRTSLLVQCLLNTLDACLPSLLVEEERPPGKAGVSDTETVGATMLGGIVDEQKQTYAAQRVTYLLVAVEKARAGGQPAEVVDQLQAVLTATLAALAPPKEPAAPDAPPEEHEGPGESPQATDPEDQTDGGA